MIKMATYCTREHISAHSPNVARTVTTDSGNAKLTAAERHTAQSRREAQGSQARGDAHGALNTNKTRRGARNKRTHWYKASEMPTTKDGDNKIHPDGKM